MGEKEKLIKLYEDASLNILNSLRDSGESVVDNQRNKIALLANIFDTIAILQGDSTALVLKVIEKAYRAGSKETLNRMTAQGAKNLEASFKTKIHREAVQAIVDESFYSILTATNHMSQDVKDRLEAIIKNANSKSLVEGVSRKAATKKAVEEATQSGITGIITSNGSKVPVEKYLSSSISYNQRKAHVDGSINRMLDNGQDLLYVNSVGITCGMCAQYQGRVYSISGKDSRFPTLTLRPPYHGHCVHSTYPWNEDYESKADVTKMLTDSNRPFEDNRTEYNLKKYKQIQRENSRKNSTRKQWIQYKSRLPDLPDLKTFASHKSRVTQSYKDWMTDYSLMGNLPRIIKPISGSSRVKINKMDHTFRNGELSKAEKAKARRLARKAKAEIDNKPKTIEKESLDERIKRVKAEKAKARREARKAKAELKPKAEIKPKAEVKPKTEVKAELTKAEKAKARRLARKAKAELELEKKPIKPKVKEETLAERIKRLKDEKADKTPKPRKPRKPREPKKPKEPKDVKPDNTEKAERTKSFKKIADFVPDNFKNQVIETFSTAPEDYQKLMSKYAKGLKVEIHKREGSYYQPGMNKVFMNKEHLNPYDVRKGEVYFHEIGHYIDFNMGKEIMGFPVAQSKNTSIGLDKILKKDYDDYRKQLRKQALSDGFTPTESSIDSQIRTQIRGHDLAGLSDTIAGVTKNKVSGWYAHDKNYWERQGMLQAEAFAEIFSARLRSSIAPYEISVFEEIFPNAVKAVDEMVKQFANSAKTIKRPKGGRRR